MFSLSNTEHVFEKRSNKSLRCEAFILLILSKKLLGHALIKFAILIKKLRIFKNFPGNLLVNRFYCSNSVEELNKVSSDNFHNRILTCIAPISNRQDSIIDLLSALKTNKFDIPGLEFIFLNVDDYIENRILNLVSNDGLLNQADKKAFQLFNDHIEEICGIAQQKGKSIILYTANFLSFPAIQAIAVDLMERYNTKSANVFLLFHLCHVNSQKRITELVRMGINQGFIPGIAISKYLTPEYMTPKQEQNNANESPCHSFNQTKRTFYEVTKFLFNNIDFISVFIVSHNPDNILYLTSLMENYQVGQSNKNVTLVQRYGMAKHISYNLANRGYNTASIVPYGTLESSLFWMDKLYQFDPSLPNILAEQRYAILRELNRRKLEN
ncbi:MAG: proline dehydrogenase family protein [Bacteroidota bacterium]